MNRIETMSRFKEPEDAAPLASCDCCGGELYEGHEITVFEGEIFCSIGCFLDYMDVREEVLEK
jgi:hypothetical protein